MKQYTLLFLRVSLGLLMIWWGYDKLFNTGHALEVSRSIYLDLFTITWLLMGFGVFQIILGVLIIVGYGRKWTYPALAVITATTLVGVWRSIVDPQRLILENTNVFFYPSLIIFAGSLVLVAFRDEEGMMLDRRPDV